MIRRILVPVDFSACSRAALDWAVRLTEQTHASIDVVHVWSTSPVEGPTVVVHVPGHASETLHQFGRVKAEQELAAFLALCEKPGVVSGFVEVGDAATVILHKAGQGYDVVVMGTHGHTGLRHLLMGSVAEKVIRRAPIPVTVVRIPG